MGALNEEVSHLKEEELIGRVVSRSGLPTSFPTHTHEPEFWEALGRAVATFGFLEKVLMRAIFSHAGTIPCGQSEADAALAEYWIPRMDKLVSDSLGKLIKTYGVAVRNHPASTNGLEDLIVGLENACKIRNAICHGSWRAPDAKGLSVPFYVNTDGEIFETPIGVDFLDQLREATVELACDVIDTVTLMGLQFPGSGGPGRKCV